LTYEGYFAETQALLGESFTVKPPLSEFMITGLHHTSFTVSNVDEAERFFVELFGMVRIGGGNYDFDYIRKIIGFQEGSLKIAVLSPSRARGDGSDHLLELIEYCSPKGEVADTATNRPGNAHLCFSVDDIHAEYERLKDKGVKFKSSPQQVTFGINQGAWGVYANGPDHIALELIQPKKPEQLPGHPA